MLPGMPRGGGPHNAGMVLLRLGVGVVFLWFGVAQLRNPDFGAPYLPLFVYSLGDSIGVVDFDRLFTVIHGAIEVALASALIVGLFTRAVALLLTVQLAVIVVTVHTLAGPATALAGPAIAVRDFGVLIAALVVAINGPDRLAADGWGGRGRRRSS